MKREKKIYWLTEDIVRYGKGKIDFDSAMAEAKTYYARKPRFVLSEWLTHVGDSYAAQLIAKRLLSNQQAL